MLRLDDDVTLAAVQVRRPCSFYGHGKDTPFFTLLGSPSSPGPTFVRAVSFSPPVKFGPWLNDVGLVASLFSWDAGWGVAFDSGDIGVIIPFEGRTWTAIDTGAAAFRAVARRDLILWRSYQATRHVVRGYTSAGGTKNYWTPPDGFSVKSVALSDTTLAWVVASGPDVDHSTWPYTTAKLHWALYTTDPAALAPRESVELPKADLIYLKTGGGFAVTRGGILSDLDADPKGVYPLVVVELTSGRSWQIFPAKNHYWIAEVMAISKDLLFVGRGDSSKNDPQSLHELVVFDLSQLDAIAQNSAPN